MKLRFARLHPVIANRRLLPTLVPLGGFPTDLPSFATASMATPITVNREFDAEFHLRDALFH
jgi:hypothetical protein